MNFPVLLCSCYELGHQPLSLAWPLAALQEAGFPVTAVDLSVSPWPEAQVAQARLVAISVPMHTALRLGVEAARRVRDANPEAHICLYGLYAHLNAGFLLGRGKEETALADSVLAGEVEPTLVALAHALAQGQDPATVPGVTTRTQDAAPVRVRPRYPVPARRPLPPLERYARLVVDGTHRLAGYTESTRGCLHTCRHCPVVPIYRGRFFAVPVETVLADIRQQVAAGAQHITFGDPDFLNGPGHARRVAQALHREFPQITFDFTTKVEHILAHPHLLQELRELGALFVVSAFESTSDAVLARLHKGHTRADLERALEVLAAADLAVQPTWLPFTPWTHLDDYLEMLAWIRAHGLVPNVPPVQLSIRLLVPPGSALLEDPENRRWFGPLDPVHFTHRWVHPDPRMDTLQQQVARIAETAVGQANPEAAFAQIEAVAYRTADRPPPPPLSLQASPEPPRLTEDWFC